MIRLSQASKVLYINSLGMRIPNLRTDRNALRKISRKLASFARYLRKDSSSGMHILSPVSLPLLGSAAGRRFNSASVRFQTRMVMSMLGIRNPIYYIGCPPAWEVIRPLKRRGLVYERTDIYEEMPGVDRQYIVRLDRELMEAADLVLYVNTAMWKEGLKVNPNSLLVGHGVDYDRFALVDRTDSVPEDIGAIRRPILGFFGDISAKTSDLALLEHTARSLPEASLVLVGSISADVSRLRTCSNVYFLGKKPYEQIPHYGKMFDVSIMPWNQNKWIEYCNPVKTKEYLALGNPIVTMYYPEVEPYRDLVYTARNHDAFVDQIRKALSENDPDLRLRRKQSVANETWDHKARMIGEHLDKILKRA